eukprot:3328762-Prymnesium_polylepis.1
MGGGLYARGAEGEGAWVASVMCACSMLVAVVRGGSHVVQKEKVYVASVDQSDGGAKGWQLPAT